MAKGSTGYIDPSTTATAALEVKYLTSTSDTASSAGLKAGFVTSGSHKYRTVVIVKIPEIYQAIPPMTSADAPYDTGMTLKNIELSFVSKASTGNDATNDYYVYHLPIDFDKYGGFYWSNDAQEMLGVGVKPTWAQHHNQASNTLDLDWTAGSPYDATSDFGFGANGVVDYLSVYAADTRYYINTAGLIDSKSYTWGDTFALLIKSSNEASSIIIEDKGSAAHTTSDHMDMNIHFDDPAPTKPILKLSADTDYKNAVLTYTTKPTDNDMVQWDHVWKIDTADVTNNVYTVNHSTSATYRSAIYDYGKESYKQADGDITSGFLDVMDTQYYLVSYALDQTSKTVSNLISKKRMSCVGSLSAGTAIGEELTLTVNGTFTDATCDYNNDPTITHDDDDGKIRKGMYVTGTGIPTGAYVASVTSDTEFELSASTTGGSVTNGTLTFLSGNFDGEFVKVGVNWEGNSTATDDLLSDYSIITLDASAATTTIKHKFDKAGTFYANAFVIDKDGFRSDFTRIASRTIAASNPVAVLRASRDTAVRAKYGDEFSVVTLSAAHSYAVGSDKSVWTHRFEHNSSTPVTTYPMENDNSNFNDVSTTIKLKCNTANCAGTVLKVFGKISVTSAGGNNVDNDANFDHYKQTVIELSPHDTAESFGTASSELFKSVDFVVVSTLDAQDATAGAVYTLADADGNVINNKIRAAKDTEAWGGYVARAAITCAFHTGNKTITNTGGTFLTDGFVAGDTIWLDGALEDSENNGFFTVSAVSANVITVNESTLVTGDGSDAGVSIYKVNGPTLPIASYDVNAPTITCSVRQALATQETGHVFQTSADVTQALRFVSEEHNTLDFDTQADAGHLAILNADLKRSGGISSLMPLGGKSYPVGTLRTRMGSPNVTMTIRALTQTGYRQLWNLIEGGRYEWVTVDSKKVDAPATAYKQIRMRLSDGTLKKDPNMASQYIANINFIVIGELVT